MTYRSRPAPRRRHRARWQDELRTQRLLVGAFATAIAIALGLFAITAWNAYYATHLQQVALVEGTAVLRGELDLRQTMIGAELEAIGTDLNSQLGGARDPIISQQLQAVSDQFQNLTSVSTDSIVDGLFQGTRAEELGVSVSDEEIDAEVADRQTLPARVQLMLIEVDALPADAPSGEEPTEEDFAAAEEEANDILAELEAGGDFAAIATERSDDPASAQAQGLVGWVVPEDAQYGFLYPLVADAEVGDLVGPDRTETGFVITRLEDRLEERPNQLLLDRLAEARATDADYRAYVGDELLRTAFRTHFEENVAVSPAPQQEIAQILVLNDQGVPVPKQRIRHLLAQPVSGSQDQSAATDEQWQAALARAEAWYEEVQDPEADWFALGEESDDPRSGSNGGDLGWSDPTSVGFVPEFQDAVAQLGVGEISEPVRTEFGYHVIQVTDRRTTALEFVEEILAEVEDDPDQFGALAREHSEDTSSRQEDGYHGWVAHYETTPIREEAIFGLTDVGQVTTEPVIEGNQIWIFKLLHAAELRSIDEIRLSSIQAAGYSRWYDELQAEGEIWIDSQLQVNAAPAA